jgi:hypothetical protein
MLPAQNPNAEFSEPRFHLRLECAPIIFIGYISSQISYPALRVFSAVIQIANQHGLNHLPEPNDFDLLSVTARSFVKLHATTVPYCPV